MGILGLCSGKQPASFPITDQKSVSNPIIVEVTWSLNRGNSLKRKLWQVSYYVVLILIEYRPNVYSPLCGIPLAIFFQSRFSHFSVLFFQIFTISNFRCLLWYWFNIGHFCCGRMKIAIWYGLDVQRECNNHRHIIITICLW